MSWYAWHENLNHLQRFVAKICLASLNSPHGPVFTSVFNIYLVLSVRHSLSTKSDCIHFLPAGGAGPDLWVLRGRDHGAGDVLPARQGAQGGRGAQAVPRHRGHQRDGRTEGQEGGHTPDQGRAFTSGTCCYCDLGLSVEFFVWYVLKKLD